MRLLALLYKEAAQHAAPIASLTVLTGAMWVLALSFALMTEASTLLTAATGMVYYGMPLVIAFVIRRLVVLEYEQNTHEFLSGLPISPLAHTVVKYLLGATVVVGLSLVAIGLTVLISLRQELLSLRFILQVCLQSGATLFGWYGLAFFLAHTGRFRTAAWMGVIAAMLIGEQLDADVYADWLWTAALGTSLDVTRLAVPWGAVLTSIAWGAVFTVAAFILATWRQGSWAAGWFRPGSSRERTGLVVLVVASWLAVDLVEAAYVPGGPSYTRLPAIEGVGAVIRTTGSDRLVGLGTDLGRALDRVGRGTGDDDWPVVVLVPVMQEAERAVHIRSWEHGELVLELDLARTDERLRVALLDALLFHRTKGLAALREETAWISEGAALWWLTEPGEMDEVTARRAGYAAVSGLPQHTLTQGLSLQRRLGPDVVEAVGFVGLRTLEQAAGRQAVVDLLARALAARRSDTALSALWMRTGWVSGALADGVGGSEEAFRMAWHAALQTHAHDQAQAINRFRPDWGTLTREATSLADVTLVCVPGQSSLDAMDVRWLEVPPMHTAPIRFDGEGYSRRVDPERCDVATSIDADQRVAATFEVYEPTIEGVLWSGMVVMP